MARTPEAIVKADIKKFLNTLTYCFFFMPVSNGMGSMGIPDIIVCYRGIFLAIEVKAPGKKSHTTALQDDKIAKIRTAGGWAIVADCVSDVERIIAELT